MEFELKTLELELELKTGIDFLQWLPQHLLINQPPAGTHYILGNG